MGTHRAAPGHARTSSTPAGYVGKRVARPREQVAPAPVLLQTPASIQVTEQLAEQVVQPVPVTTPVPARQPGGRRKAERPRRSVAVTGPLFSGLRSAPTLLGVAALAVAVGGTLTLDGTASAGPSSASLQGADEGQALPQSETTRLLQARDQLLNRGGNRATAQQAEAAAPSSATLARHDAAVGQLAKSADQQAARLNDNRWITPIPAGSYVLTAGFGQTSSLWASFHTGLDFAAPTGTPIHAVSSGTITDAGWAGAYGNRTVETLPDGTEIWYCHQTEIDVSIGDAVTRDELIGLVGATGNVTGPHVHIEVRPGGGDPVDPFPAFVAHGITP